MKDRELLIARASYWSGRCTDANLTEEEYAELGAFLLEVKDRMRVDR